VREGTGKVPRASAGCYEHTRRGCCGRRRGHAWGDRDAITHGVIPIQPPSIRDGDESAVCHRCIERSHPRTIHRKSDRRCLLTVARDSTDQPDRSEGDPRDECDDRAKSIEAIPC